MADGSGGLNTILNLIYSALLIQEEHNVNKAEEHEKKEKEKKKKHVMARKNTIEKKDKTDLNDYERDNTEYHDIEELKE